MNKNTAYQETFDINDLLQVPELRMLHHQRRVYLQQQRLHLKHRFPETNQLHPLFICHQVQLVLTRKTKSLFLLFNHSSTQRQTKTLKFNSVTISKYQKELKLRRLVRVSSILEQWLKAVLHQILR